MIFLDKSAVLEIQSQLIERYGGIHGLRDEGALESALAAENRAHYENALVEFWRRLTPIICRRRTLFSTATNELPLQQQVFFSN